MNDEKRVIVTAFISAIVEGVRLLGQLGADEDALYESVAGVMDRKAFDMIVNELIEQKTLKRRRLYLVYCGPCMLEPEER